MKTLEDIQADLHGAEQAVRRAARQLWPIDRERARRLIEEAERVAAQRWEIGMIAVRQALPRSQTTACR